MCAVVRACVCACVGAFLFHAALLWPAFFSRTVYPPGASPPPPLPCCLHVLVRHVGVGNDTYFLALNPRNMGITVATLQTMIRLFRKRNLKFCFPTPMPVARATYSLSYPHAYALVPPLARAALGACLCHLPLRAALGASPSPAMQDRLTSATPIASKDMIDALFSNVSHFNMPVDRAESIRAFACRRGRGLFAI